MRDKPSQVTALVGGQYGSEGKGAIAAHLAKEYDIAIRVGAANAGHTFYTHRTKPEKHVVQQLPCAAYANPECLLVLGPGALISLDVLSEEIAANTKWREERGLRPAQLLIDWRAHVVQEHHIVREQSTDLATRIGSTSTIAKEGIGAAEAAKVMRENECVQAREIGDTLEGLGSVQVSDVVAELHHALNTDRRILLEGTQGTGLSLTHGDFPYTTSRDTTAGALAAQCGIGPTLVDDVFMVMRTYPIRVHGNSGPFWYDSEETTFQKLGLEPERTTVTKLERRIATFSYRQAQVAAMLNGATGIALTFADYVVPGLAGITDPKAGVDDEKSRELLAMVNTLERECRCPVYWVGTGPDSIIERYDRSTIEAARGWAYTTPEPI